MEEQAANNQLDIEYTNPPPYSSSADNLPVVESAIQTEVPATYHGSSTQNIDPQRLASKTSPGRASAIISGHLQPTTICTSAGA